MERERILWIPGIGKTGRMNGAKISASGQIAAPVEVRRLPGGNPGDTIFLPDEAGVPVISSASAQPVYRAQTAFKGGANRLRLSPRRDMQELIRELRYAAH